MANKHSDNPGYRRDNQLETIRDRAEDGTLDRELARRLIELAAALDGENPKHKYIAPNGERKEYSPGTIYQYLHVLVRWHDLDGIDYLNTTAKEINDLAADMDTGLHPESPDGGYSRQTVNKFLCAAKAFYHYHSDLGIAHGEVDMFKKANRPAYDDRDMFTREEINALRDAMPDTRWRALLEMMIFTGQRIHAIMTLRIKDIDVNEGVFYLNDDEYGLKGADKRGLKRPLLGARAYVRDWLQYHPRKDDPEAPVFIGDPSNAHTKFDQPMNTSSIRRGLRKAAEKAGIKKDVKPHKMRHYFVTVMKRDHGLDDDTIKFLLGHAKDSNVMSTTYQHISADDYVKSAEAAFGIGDDDDGSPVVPELCPTCGRTLKSTDKACSNCGELITPDAQATKRQVKEMMFDAGISGNLSKDELKALKTAREKLDDDEAETLIDIIDGLQADG
ncbi:tyrosine-type recombinase/integrase [Halobellus limi]|uniref:Integrase n=1 Tax=Halobellus limi TaxID=699433 RepID=A0A1H5ZFS3_9EURY|nr:tyrosine-type recombinase/integrase [Halobellus limi]QCC48135.1 integrase [Halobellus limi]SEG34236.1 Site-specific recombinase XerD [Halobellus limi]